MGGNGIYRLHFLDNLPISLADDVYLYERATVETKLRRWLSQLYEIMLSCVAIITSANYIYTRSALNNMCTAAGVEENVYKRANTTKVGVLAHLRSIGQADVAKVEERTWEDLPTQLGSDNTLCGKKLTLNTIAAFWKTKLGMAACPVFAAQNYGAFKLMLSHVQTFEQCPDGIAGATRLLRILLDIDQRTCGEESYWYRSDGDQLETWIQDCIANNGIDDANICEDMALKHKQPLLGLAHGRKARHRPPSAPCEYNAHA